ncbi:MAG: DNRLRE domain-containing protein [bacterium]
MGRSYILIGLLFLIAGCGNREDLVGPEVSNRFENWPTSAILEFSLAQDSYYPQTVNTGSREKLLAGRWEGYKARTLLKFDLSDIPDTAAIQEATLELYCFGSYGSSQVSLSLHEVTETWEEDKVTWKDDIAFHQELDTKEIIGAGTVSWSGGIMEAVRGRLTNGSISLLIRSTQEDIDTSLKEFYSKEKTLGIDGAETSPSMTVKYELEGETEAASVKLNPIEDVFIITKSESETPTGQEDVLVVGAFNGYSHRMALQFSIFPGEEDELPNEATIDKAELRLHGYNILGEEGSSLSVSIYAITEKWTEGEADLASYNPTAKAAGELTSDTSSLNITSLVDAWNREGGNLGLLIKPTDEVEGSSFKGVYSSEHPTPELRPVVVVTYTLPPTKPGYDK